MWQIREIDGDFGDGECDSAVTAGSVATERGDTAPVADPGRFLARVHAVDEIEGRRTDPRAAPIDQVRPAVGRRCNQVAAVDVSVEQRAWKLLEQGRGVRRLAQFCECTRDVTSVH